MRFNVLAMSGRAVEAAGDVNTLLLDKTGTITLGNRQAAEFIALPDTNERELAEAALLSSLADETPEGRSIVTLARDKYGFEARSTPTDARFVPFSAQTRMSGVDLDGRSIRKGAVDSILALAKSRPTALQSIVERISKSGGTPLAVSVDGPRSRRDLSQGHRQKRDS